MPVTVAIYDKTIERLKSRIEALGPDITLVPFTADGHFLVNGSPVAPSETDIDYLWLSPDLSMDGIVGPTFEMAADTRSIKVLQTFNAGLDHPAYKKISSKGVRICNSSAQAIAISEYVMAHVLDQFQPLQKRRELQAEKTWERTPFREISRTNWLIFGFGPIGRSVAERAKAFGANITVVRRSPQTSAIVDRAGTLADVPEFLADTDVIVLACPLNDATRGLANDAFFTNAKPGALLVNIARGAIIDDTALMAALDNGRLSAAVLDVFHEEPLPEADPLWSHPKVFVTAHTSFNGSGVRTRWDELFFDNLPRYLRGESLVNEVAPGDI